MRLNSQWTTGVLSSLAAFLLTYSIEGFGSLPLFWVLYIVLGAVWLATTAVRHPDTTRAILSIPSLLLILGIASLFANFYPLAMALFIVFVNTRPGTGSNQGWRLAKDLLTSAIYLTVTFVLVLVCTYFSLFAVPIAYVLAFVAIIASIRPAFSGITAAWGDAMIAVLLVAVLVIFNDKYASLGTAAAAAGLALLIGVRRLTKSNQQSHTLVELPNF